MVASAPIHGTKLHIPPPPPKVVIRPRLIERLKCLHSNSKRKWSNEKSLARLDAPRAIFRASCVQYTVKLGGTLRDTVVDAQVESEEVASADTLHLPSAASSQEETETASATAEAKEWLIWLGPLLGLIGIVIGAIALRELVDQRNLVLINDPNQTLTTEYKPVKMQSQRRINYS